MSNNAQAASKAPYCPSPYSYAVIRMDPVAMVEHLDDPEALEAAKALRPKPYLVYIDCDHSLPFPGVPWYGFYVQLIAPSLPPTDEEQCTTSDMCTPIFPNTTHPLGRPPLVPGPPGSFPYTNCYHWPEMGLDIRVLARPEGFDRAKMVRLPAEEALRLGICMAEDTSKRLTALKARNGPVGGDTSGDHPASAAEGDAFDDEDAHSVRTASSGYSDSWSDSEESANMMDGFFGDPTQNVEILPLVHLWVDMASNFKEDEIADPRGMYEERDAIVSIIQAARARNPSLPPLLPPVPTVFQDLEEEEVHGNRDADDAHSTLSEDLVHSEANSGLASDHAGLTKSRRFRPSKLLRKLGVSVRQMFRVPYLPVWP